MQALHPQRGLTLIEAAVVVAIVATVATAAAPGLGRLIDHHRLEAGASQLAADLQLARNESIARNRVVRVSWQAAANCYVVHTGAADQCTCAADGSGQCSAGATLLQAYTGFIYGGPGWPRRIHRGLAARVRAAGLTSIEQAIGADVAAS